MAKNEIDILLGIDDKVSKVLDKVEGKSKKMAETFKKSSVEINASIELMRKGLVALQKGLEFVERGAKFEQQQEAFRRIAKQAGASSDEVVQKMEDMAGGTLSASDTMQAATRAMVLGLDPNKLPKLMEIARASARAFGTDVGFMFESLSLGIGRQSRMLLDNLGIIVDAESAYKKYAAVLGVSADSLTDAEKKQAFLNAALEAGQMQVDAMDLSVQTQAERIGKLKAEWKNFVDGLAVAVSKIVAVQFAIEGVSNALEFYSNLLKGINDIEINLDKNFSSALPALTNSQKELVKIQEERDDLQRRLRDGLIGGEVVHERINNLLIQEKRLTETIIRLRAEAANLPAEEGGQEDITVFEENMQRKRTAIEEFQQQLSIMSDDEIAREVTKLEQLSLLNKTFEEAKTDLLKKENIKRTQEDKKRHKAEQLAQLQALNTAVAIFGILAEENKAFAIAQKTISVVRAVINSHLAATKVLAETGNPVLAGIVKALGFVEAAAIAATPLAEGGIVKARPGGIVANIGEGGRDEAVIPLDDNRASGILGNTINITIQNANLSSDRDIADTAEMLGREFENATRTGRAV